jgi:hypothetical protein
LAGAQTAFKIAENKLVIEVMLFLIFYLRPLYGFRGKKSQKKSNNFHLGFIFLALSPQ